MALPVLLSRMYEIIELDAIVLSIPLHQLTSFEASLPVSVSPSLQEVSFSSVWLLHAVYSQSMKDSPLNKLIILAFGKLQ